jgi:hypothetical protein
MTRTLPQHYLLRICPGIFSARGWSMASKASSTACVGSGLAARPVRRPHLGQDHAHQPVAAMVCGDGLCAGLRLAPDCPAAHAVCRGDLRYDPPQAVQDRRAGAGQRPPHQDRAGSRLSLPKRVRPRAGVGLAKARMRRTCSTGSSNMSARSNERPIFVA